MFILWQFKLSSLTATRKRQRTVRSIDFLVEARRVALPFFSKALPSFWKWAALLYYTVLHCITLYYTVSCFTIRILNTTTNITMNTNIHTNINTNTSINTDTPYPHPKLYPYLYLLQRSPLNEPKVSSFQREPRPSFCSHYQSHYNPKGSDVIRRSGQLKKTTQKSGTDTNTYIYIHNTNMSVYI